MTGATRLTEYDNRSIAEARVLVGLTAPDAVREYTGDPDPLMAYAVAFGRLQHHARDLLAIIDRLEGQPEAVVVNGCPGCHTASRSVLCPRCGGPSCARCGRCPPCDGPVPDEEE